MRGTIACRGLRALPLALAVLCVAFFAMPGAAFGQGSSLPQEPGAWFQYCACLEGGERAEALARRLAARLPGLEIRVEQTLAPGPGGQQRAVGLVFVRHAQLTPAQVCTRLGPVDCPPSDAPAPVPGGGE